MVSSFHCKADRNSGSGITTPVSPELEVDTKGEESHEEERAALSIPLLHASVALM